MSRDKARNCDSFGWSLKAYSSPGLILLCLKKKGSSNSKEQRINERRKCQKQKQSAFPFPLLLLISVSPHKVHPVKLTARVYFAFRLCLVWSGIDGGLFSRSLQIPEEIFLPPHWSLAGQLGWARLLTQWGWTAGGGKAILQSGWQIIKEKTDSKDLKDSRDTPSEAKWHWYQHLGNDRGR